MITYKSVLVHALVMKPEGQPDEMTMIAIVAIALGPALVLEPEPEPSALSSNSKH
jgi:hypothetical protein